MMSRARFSYQRLVKDQETTSPSAVAAALEAARGIMMSARAWSRLRRVPVRRRVRVRGFRARLQRFMRSRRSRLVRNFKGSWEKIVRRARESGAHFGDLFAGNYLLLQVNPTPLLKVEGNEKWGKGRGLRFLVESRNPRYYLPQGQPAAEAML